MEDLGRSLLLCYSLWKPESSTNSLTTIPMARHWGSNHAAPNDAQCATLLSRRMLGSFGILIIRGDARLSCGQPVTIALWDAPVTKALLSCWFKLILCNVTLRSILCVFFSVSTFGMKLRTSGSMSIATGRAGRAATAPTTSCTTNEKAPAALPFQRQKNAVWSKSSTWALGYIPISKRVNRTECRRSPNKQLSLFDWCFPVLYYVFVSCQE